MLVNYELRNYKSFGKGNRILMQATSEEFKSNILIQTKNHPIKPSAILYGLNGSGKKNLALGLAFMKELIFNTHRPLYEQQEMLRTLPFFENDLTKPIFMQIDLIENHSAYTYIIEFAITKNHHAPTNELLKIEILHEILIKDNQILFIRRSKQNNNNQMQLNEKYNHEIIPTLQKNLATDKLLLHKFSREIDKETATEFLAGLKKIVLFSTSSIREDAPSFYKKLLEKISKEKLFGDKTFSYEYEYSIYNQKKPPQFFVEYEHNNESKKRKLQVIEEKETVRALSLLMRVQDALDRGLTLWLDHEHTQFDPSMILGVIDLFHNQEINKTGAQFMFSTNDPIYKCDLFRNDQIYLVEKNEKTNESKIFGLTTNGHFENNKSKTPPFRDLSNIFSTQD